LYYGITPETILNFEPVSKPVDFTNVLKSVMLILKFVVLLDSERIGMFALSVIVLLRVVNLGVSGASKKKYNPDLALKNVLFSINKSKLAQTRL